MSLETNYHIFCLNSQITLPNKIQTILENVNFITREGGESVIFFSFLTEIPVFFGIVFLIVKKSTLFRPEFCRISLSNTFSS